VFRIRSPNPAITPTFCVRNAKDQVADLIRDQSLIAIGAAFVIEIIAGQLGPNLTVAVAPEGVRTQRRKARAGEPT
jgi:hypothetical protein